MDSFEAYRQEMLQGSRLNRGAGGSGAQLQGRVGEGGGYYVVEERGSTASGRSRQAPTTIAPRTDHEEDDWTTDSTDPTDDDDNSSVSTMTSDSGSQLSDGLVIAKKHCALSHTTTYGALSSASVDGHHHEGNPQTSGPTKRWVPDPQSARSHGSRHPSQSCDRSTTQHLSERRMRIEEEHFRNCTFRPRILESYAGTGVASEMGGEAGDYGEDRGQDWVERLYTQEHSRRTEAAQKRMTELRSSKHRKDIEEYLEHCTFKPTINTKNDGSLRRDSVEATSYVERLYGDPRRHKTAASTGGTKVMSKEELELSECTFHPKVTEFAKNLSAQSNRTNVFESLSQRRQPPPPPPAPAAKPTVNKNRKSEPQRPGGPWWDRMHKIQAENQEKIEKKREKQLRDYDKAASRNAVNQGTRTSDAVFDRLYEKHTAAFDNRNNTPPEQSPPPATSHIPKRSTSPKTSANTQKAHYMQGTFAQPAPYLTAAASQFLGISSQPRSLPPRRTEDEDKLKILQKVVAVHRSREDVSTFPVNNDGNETEEEFDV